MSKVIRKVFKNDAFHLHECTDGYYLWDNVLKINLSIRAKTEEDAYIEGLLYYQNRLSKLKADYKTLNDKVESFLCQFDRDDE